MYFLSLALMYHCLSVAIGVCGELFADDLLKIKIKLTSNLIQGYIPASFRNLVHLGNSIQFSMIIALIHLALLGWNCAAITLNVCISLCQLIVILSLCSLQNCFLLYI